MNSNIYMTEADNYYERNKNAGVSHFAVTLASLLDLSDKDVAEFGIGNAASLSYLSTGAKSIHGYEASAKAVENARRLGLGVTHCNITTMPPGPKGDVIIYGFFAYYADGPEMAQVYKTTLEMLNPGGFVFVYDFLTRHMTSHPDKYNAELSVFKRPLWYWNYLMKDFDLINYSLCDWEKADEEWTFSALYRRVP